MKHTTPNNESIKMFKTVVNLGRFQTVDRRCVLKYANRSYSFSYWDKKTREFYVRQAYDDTDGVCVMYNGILHFVDRKKLSYDASANRITPDGMKRAYTARGNLSNAFSRIDILALANSFEVK